MTENDEDQYRPVKLGEPAAEAAVEGAPVKTVEAWATAKGLYPQMQAAPSYGLPAGAWAGQPVAVSMGGIVGPKPNEDYWRFAAAKAMCGWPEGKELTEAEFDAAVLKATTQVGR